MVLLVTTPTILSALETLPQSSRDELDLPHSPILDTPISHLQLISLAQHLSRIEEEEEGTEVEAGNEKVEAVAQCQAKAVPTFTLNSLLRGTKVYVPPPPSKSEPSPEFLALKARLQAAADEDAYRRLLSSPQSPSSHRPSPIFSTSSAVAALHRPDDDDGSTDPLTPSLVLNIFLSVLLCGFSTYWALTHFQTPAFLSFTPAKSTAGTTVPTAEPAFVLIAVLVGLLVGVAEVVVYAAYLRKVVEARARERAFKEQKDAGLVDPGVAMNFKSETQMEKNENEGEPQEIWGRGVNGGVRRRVRERWKEGNGIEKSAD